ncbi:hypothetical protein EV651_104118 [Kribbella sp. VKM Ac-2571]|nr:hypothetical protein EV651_104118 [Kribbella sp. VKM Ac-2571]
MGATFCVSPSAAASSRWLRCQRSSSCSKLDGRRRPGVLESNQRPTRLVMTTLGMLRSPAGGDSFRPRERNRGSADLDRSVAGIDLAATLEHLRHRFAWIVESGNRSFGRSPRRSPAEHVGPPGPELAPRPPVLQPDWIGLDRRIEHHRQLEERPSHRYTKCICPDRHPTQILRREQATRLGVPLLGHTVFPARHHEARQEPLARSSNDGTRHRRISSGDRCEVAVR